LVGAVSGQRIHGEGHIKFSRQKQGGEVVRMLVTKRCNEVEKTSQEGAAGCQTAAVDMRCSTKKEAMSKRNKVRTIT
jgi:hypothetical protein